MFYYSIYCLKPGSCELLFCLSEFNHQLIIALIQIFHSPDKALIITVINLVMPSLTLVKCYTGCYVIVDLFLF